MDEQIKASRKKVYANICKKKYLIIINLKRKCMETWLEKQKVILIIWKELILILS